MSDLTNKDAEQDTKLAVLESTLENSVRRIEMVHQRIDRSNEDLEKLRDRIRVLERWVPLVVIRRGWIVTQHLL